MQLFIDKKDYLVHAQNHSSTISPQFGFGLLHILSQSWGTSLTYSLNAAGLMCIFVDPSDCFHLTFHPQIDGSFKTQLSLIFSSLIVGIHSIKIFSDLFWVTRLFIFFFIFLSNFFSFFYFRNIFLDFFADRLFSFFPNSFMSFFVKLTVLFQDFQEKSRQLTLYYCCYHPLIIIIFWFLIFKGLPIFQGRKRTILQKIVSIVILGRLNRLQLNLLSRWGLVFQKIDKGIKLLCIEMTGVSRERRFEFLNERFSITFVIQLLQIIISGMAECNIDVKIGTNGSQIKENYSAVEISLQMNQQKLPKINSQLCNLLAKTTAPFIVIEYPHAHPEQTIFRFDSKDFEAGEHVHHGRLVQFANPKQKDTIKLIRNMEKQFQKITKLKNQCNLKVSLYRDGEGQSKKGLEILDKAKIKGHVQTDQNLVISLIEIIRRISNQFLNSPVMAILELFQQLNFKVEMEQTSQFPQELKKWLFKQLDFSAYFNRENSSKTSSSKGQIMIHITLPKLLSLKVKVQASTLASFMAAFS